MALRRRSSFTRSVARVGRWSEATLGIGALHDPVVGLAAALAGEGDLPAGAADSGNGKLLLNTPNDGKQVTSRIFSGAATYTFKLCEAATTTCSNEASVTFK